MKTDERILATALELFNEQGCQTVTTNHIAQALGISPGNLYYHFRNKEEIIRALYAQLAEEQDRAFGMPEGHVPGLEELETLLKVNFKLLWRYRFFYRELLALLSRDPELARDYKAVRAQGYKDFLQLFRLFVKGKVLQPMPKTEVIQRARLCWMVSEFWLNSLELEGAPLTERRLSQGAGLLRLVLKV